MSTVTYFDTGKPAKTATERPGFWRRLFDRLIESRLRHAQDELKRHSHLLPRELDAAGWKVSARSEDSLPFVH